MTVLSSSAGTVGYRENTNRALHAIVQKCFHSWHSLRGGQGPLVEVVRSEAMYNVQTHVCLHCGTGQELRSNMNFRAKPLADMRPHASLSISLHSLQPINSILQGKTARITHCVVSLRIGGGRSGGRGSVAGLGMADNSAGEYENSTGASRWSGTVTDQFDLALIMFLSSGSMRGR